MFLSCFSDNDTLTEVSCNRQSASAALPCDAWHHYYHYQSSAQYLWLAETLRGLGRHEEASAAYGRAIFQDHSNEEALEGSGKAARSPARAPRYDKHPFFDRDFRSLIGELPDDATTLHDAGAVALQAGDLQAALAHLGKAIAAVPLHSNSYFTRGKCRFYEQKSDAALSDFSEAIRLSHLHHDRYHRAASVEHLLRGQDFFRQGKLDLAVNDFTKALDLHKNNKDALAARALAYQAKGSTELAQEDERLLQSKLHW